MPRGDAMILCTFRYFPNPTGGKRELRLDYATTEDGAAVCLPSAPPRELGAIKHPVHGWVILEARDKRAAKAVAS